MLRRRKVLGATGIGLALAASLAGGGSVEVDRALDAAPMYLGLDWFLLNVLLLVLLFVPLERLWAAAARAVGVPAGLDDRPGVSLREPPARAGLDPAQADAGSRAVRLGGSPGDPGHRAGTAGGAPVPRVRPGCRLTEYWVHRLFHTSGRLSPFHAVHHSSTSMDWLAGSRLHVVDVVITRGLTFVPLFLLGFHTGPLYAYLVFVSIHAVFIHANVSWKFPHWVEALVVTPRFHHRHHGIEREAIDKNFADKLFGTYQAPESRWPAGYGIEGNPVPDGYLAQLAYPARRKSEAPAEEPKP
jgi:hypothetical protein